MNAGPPTDLIGYSAAAALLPPYRGERAHASTIYRWVQCGRLRGWKTNGLKVSRSELLALIETKPVKAIPQPRSHRCSLAAHKQAMAELKRMGAA